MNDLLSTFLQVVIAIAVPAIGTLGGYGIKQAADWLKLKQDSEIRTYLNDALSRGLDLAVAQLHARMPISGVYAGHALGELADTVASYAVAKVPDALARFGLDKSSLDEIILARIATRPAAQAVLSAAQDPGPKPDFQSVLNAGFGVLQAALSTAPAADAAQPAG